MLILFFGRLGRAAEELALPRRAQTGDGNRKSRWRPRPVWGRPRRRGRDLSGRGLRRALRVQMVARGVFEVAGFLLPFQRGGMLPIEREPACPATLPQIPIPACLVCLVIVNSKHSRLPLFVTWWPKWPELAEDASGASGCGVRSRELASRSLPLGTCFDEASVSTS